MDNATFKNDFRVEYFPVAAIKGYSQLLTYNGMRELFDSEKSFNKAIARIEDTEHWMKKGQNRKRIDKLQIKLYGDGLIKVNMKQTEWQTANKQREN